jgi:hypothetical protein
MTARKGLLVLGLAAALAAAAGTSWAVTQGDDDADRTWPVPTAGELVHARAPSGAEYTVSGIDPARFGRDPGSWFCVAITMPAAGTQGCNPVPDGDGRIFGQPWRPSYALLGADRFFMAIAPRGVTAMEVQVHGEAAATRSQSIDAGPAGTLLLVAVGGPQVTSRDPGSSQSYDVRLLDGDGKTVVETSTSDAG